MSYENSSFSIHSCINKREHSFRKNPFFIVSTRESLTPTQRNPPRTRTHRTTRERSRPAAAPHPHRARNDTATTQRPGIIRSVRLNPSLLWMASATRPAGDRPNRTARDGAQCPVLRKKPGSGPGQSIAKGPDLNPAPCIIACSAS